MTFKAVEYYTDYKDNLVPGLAFNDTEWTEPQQVKLFLMFYYIITGLHAVHLTIGIGIILYLAHHAYRGRYSPEHSIPVDVSGLYWHFVDIIWIFLLPLLYLIVRHTSGDLHF